MRYLWLCLIALALAGCATPPAGEVSPLPWNRPQSWEQGGTLGAMPLPGNR
jgi:hypothetical protein